MLFSRDLSKALEAAALEEPFVASFVVERVELVEPVADGGGPVPGLTSGRSQKIAHCSRLPEVGDCYTDCR
jgi:hypothetical protein